ncbi:unnamed protein product [Parnassius apollo]|uniref:(apollo) hypothetical protein n=1 Tax=Parnassius apollo TaxID=110799 RepID=A0A8S3XAX5_PARAO|nr:unnamed protein product [Parnassius apollo]
MGSLSRNGVQILPASSPTYTYSYQSPASHQSPSPVPSLNALHSTTTYQSPAPHQSPSPVPSPNALHSTTTYQSPAPHQSHLQVIGKTPVHGTAKSLIIVPSQPMQAPSVSHEQPVIHVPEPTTEEEESQTAAKFLQHFYSF